MNIYFQIEWWLIYYNEWSWWIRQTMSFPFLRSQKRKYYGMSRWVRGDSSQVLNCLSEMDSCRSWRVITYLFKDFGSWDKPLLFSLLILFSSYSINFHLKNGDGEKTLSLSLHFVFIFLLFLIYRNDFFDEASGFHLTFMRLPLAFCLSWPFPQIISILI